MCTLRDQLLLCQMCFQPIAAKGDRPLWLDCCRSLQLPTDSKQSILRTSVGHKLKRRAMCPYRPKSLRKDSRAKDTAHVFWKEHTLDRLVTADARIERWKRWWCMDDPYIRCLHCRAGQPLGDAGKPFNPLHLANCPLRSHLPQYPWQALSALLRDWQHGQDSDTGAS